ncbi:MAG: toxin-antitoxin system YwqK family antitoxin [Bacteroidales bacterium]|nr:toxin-antitoxin system YwqK family antitoxin [Bacteroidales bacterium]
MEKMLLLISIASCILLITSCNQSYSPEQVTFSNDSAYVLINNKKTPLTGYIRTYYDTNLLKSVKTYKNGVPNGYYIRFYPNGQMSLKMIYSKGTPVQFIQYYENAKIKTLQVNNDTIQYILRYSEQGKLIRKETLKNKLLNGRTITYFDDGSVESILHYSNGKKHGPFVLFYPNKKIKAHCHFKNDSIDGIFKTWNEDGCYGIELFSMGKRIGTWKYYYPNGKIKTIITFHNNSLVKERIDYDEKGNIVSKFTSNLETL